MTPTTIQFDTRPPYLYPPRPENAVHPRFLPEYDDGTWIAEPKLDGDCAVIMTDGIETIVMDRHNKTFSKDIAPLKSIAQTLHTGNGWCVLVGEYMAKGKRNAEGRNMNGALVLFDIIVHNGLHLGEYTFAERHALLKSLYPAEEYDGYIVRATNDLFLVKAFTSHFTELFERVTEIQMYEGLVLKKHDAKLELGTTPKNNWRTQVKFRRPAKNYHY